MSVTKNACELGEVKEGTGWEGESGTWEGVYQLILGLSSDMQRCGCIREAVEVARPFMFRRHLQILQSSYPI